MQVGRFLAARIDVPFVKLLLFRVPEARPLCVRLATSLPEGGGVGEVDRLTHLIFTSSSLYCIENLRGLLVMNY